MNLIFRELKNDFRENLKDLKESRFGLNFASQSSNDNGVQGLSIRESLIKSELPFLTLERFTTEERLSTFPDQIKIDEAYAILTAVPTNLLFIEDADMKAVERLVNQHRLSEFKTDPNFPLSTHVSVFLPATSTNWQPVLCICLLVICLISVFLIANAYF